MDLESCFSELGSDGDHNSRNDRNNVTRINGHSELENGNDEPANEVNLPNFRFFQKFPSQYFDTERDCDFVTALAFDPTGEFLAVGDKSGRVAVLRRKSKALGAGKSCMDKDGFESFGQRLERKASIGEKHFW